MRCLFLKFLTSCSKISSKFLVNFLAIFPTLSLLKLMRYFFKTSSKCLNTTEHHRILLTNLSLRFPKILQNFFLMFYEICWEIFKRLYRDISKISTKIFKVSFTVSLSFLRNISKNFVKVFQDSVTFPSLQNGIQNFFKHLKKIFLNYYQEVFQLFFKFFSRIVLTLFHNFSKFI